MIEAALHVAEKATERRGSIALIRGSAGLKVVDADFGRRVRVVTRLGEKRRYVTSRALGRPDEDRFASGRGMGIEIARGGRRCRDRKLVELEVREFGGDEVGSATDVAGPRLDGNRKLRCAASAPALRRGS